MTHTPTGMTCGEWGLGIAYFHFSRARWGLGCLDLTVLLTFNYNVRLRVLDIRSDPCYFMLCSCLFNASAHVSGENTCDASSTLLGVFMKSSGESCFVGV
jgi:hypothetical protein